MPYNKLDISQWGKGDFTDVTAEGITGTIFSDETLLTAFDLTNYTLEFVFFDIVTNKVVKNGLNPTIVVAANGTYRFLPVVGDLDFKFVGDVLVKLTKTGSELHAWGVSGSARLQILDTD